MLTVRVITTLSLLQAAFYRQYLKYTEDRKHHGNIDVLKLPVCSDNLELVFRRWKTEFSLYHML